MQFFKFSAALRPETQACDPDENDVFRSYTRLICNETGNLADRLKEKGYIFVSDVRETALYGCILANNDNVITRYLRGFLESVGADGDSAEWEEITFRTFDTNLRHADRSNLIDDDDDVLELFGLESLRGRNFRGMDFGENMVDVCTREQLYAAASGFFAKDDMLPELDRIFAGTTAKAAKGHPVHYIVAIDDKDTRREMYRTLLSALHVNNRLHNRRYSYFDVAVDDQIAAGALTDLYRLNAGGAVVIRLASEFFTGDDDYATAQHETVENICSAMTKFRNEVLTVLCFPRECSALREVFYENLATLSLVEWSETPADVARATEYLKTLAKENGVRTDKRLFAQLEEGQTYLVPDLRFLFSRWYDAKLKTGIYPQYKTIASVQATAVKEAVPRGSAYDELRRMVGLSRAKQVIDEVVNYAKAQKLYASLGMQYHRPSLHMLFTGSPGTAKTSVARLLARIFKENGVLSRGELIEVGRQDLVGKYVGWTAPQVEKIFKRASGNLLFIDEAYSLNDRDGLFADEAIAAIVAQMENHRNDVVVVFAGYPDKMEAFLQKNEGLRSRIAFHIPFDDYTTDELVSIADLMAEKGGFSLSPEAREKLTGICAEARVSPDFGNGRFVRNLLEQAKMRQASRLLALDPDTLTRKTVTTVTADDIPVPTVAKPETHIGFCA